jgi:Fe-S-cluster containining protein
MLSSMRLPEGDRGLVQIVDAALAEATVRAGVWLLCREGCTQCCMGAFAINSLDALRLQAGMETLRSAEPSLAAEVERRARGWIAEFAADFPGDAQTGALGETRAERERFEEFANDAPCPALDPATGRCDLYAWRPMTCRVFGPPIRMEGQTADGDALGHCELCFAGAGEAEVAACEIVLPHEQEARLLGEVERASGAKGETVVAYALVEQLPASSC